MLKYQKTLPKKPYTWSGNQPIPAVGAVVHMDMNGAGACKIKGYTVLEGFLGVVAEPLDPPQAWTDFQKARKDRSINHLFFGVDLTPATPQLQEGSPCINC